mgnify:CR=1 FL=1
MDLYKIKKDNLKSAEETPFKLEGDIYFAVKSNVCTLFDLEFFKSEFLLEKLRLEYAFSLTEPIPPIIYEIIHITNKPIYAKT